jgi:hypothetical protein
MVELVALEQRGDAWEATLRIREGVYRLDRYPVIIEHVPAPPPDWDAQRQRERLAAFVQEAVTRHFRRGSLPPRGTRLDGSAIWEHASAVSNAGG